MKSFTDTIDDLSIALFEDEGNDRLSCVDQLITSVKSTMSDRGHINPCFNKQLPPEHVQGVLLLKEV
jgi:hypothetical protein